MKKILIISIIILIIGGVFAYTKYMPNLNKDNSQNKINSNSTTGQAEKPAINESGKKEVHIVNISGLNVSIEMTVNGADAFSDNFNGSVSVGGFNLTPFIKNGENTVKITVKALPSESEISSCNLKFGYADLNISDNVIYNDNGVIDCGDTLKNKGVEDLTYVLNANI